MAENLVGKFHYGVLHTRSDLAENNISYNFISNIKRGSDSIDKKVSKLEQKEQELYSRFGTNNYKEFISQLQHFFNSEDRTVLERFEANRLGKTLQGFADKKGSLYEKEVRLIIDPSKIKTAKVKIPKSKDIISFECVYNTDALKQAFNEIFQTTKFRGEYSGTIDRLIQNLLDDEALRIEVAKGKGTNKKYEQHRRSRIPNYPWGITRNDILDAEHDPVLRKDLEEALQKIRDFIFNSLGAGATSDLKRAMQSVWTHNYGRKWSDPLAFFAGTTTTNFASLVQGSLGEFQTAVIFEYLSLKHLSAKGIAEIQGNVFTKGEQAKTDVQIFNSLGIQVKNVTTFEKDGRLSMLRDLKTTIHPDKFAKYLSGKDKVSFLDFLANYYFNATYQEHTFEQMRQLKEGLGEWLVELMNMAMVDSEVGDTVSFYLIGGKYLVPCSALIRASKELNLKDSILIKGSYNAKTDEEYAEEKDKKGSFLYQKFWHKQDDQWYPTGENINTYYNLIGRRISIKTFFGLFDEIEKYALWQ